ncbi:MAG: MFS transporter [Actinomycetota bacterium]|nr:MFS transporter [Actinomycetota bacterium]
MATPSTPEQQKALAVIAGSQLLVLTLWFSASAVAPSLEIEWGLTSGQATWLTLAVQIGFVIGALVSATLNLADIVNARTLFLTSALIAALANASLILLGDNPFIEAVALRLVVGVALAGVYPSGLKVMAGWFKVRRGMALGVLVGALTVGSATPHLVRGLGLEWQAVIAVSSVLAALGGVLLWLTVKDGPYEAPAAVFSIRLVGQVLKNRGVRLSTYGYLGHMWELYAMWTWTAAFLVASAEYSGISTGWVPTATFAVIAIGGVGSWAAGKAADAVGKERIAGLAMIISGSCAMLTPLVFGLSMWLVIPVFLVWGFTVIADSAQFSALVTDTADERYRGTALTLQTAVGFLLTLVTIRGVPWIADQVGWRWSFLWLAIGPALGVVAMIKLRNARANGEISQPV